MEKMNVRELVKKTDEGGTYSKHRSKNRVNVGKNERILSTVGGVGLIAYGAKRRDLVGTLLGLVGAGLAYRGTTGQCAAYKALDVDTNKNSGGSSVSKKVGDTLNSWFDQKVEVVKSVIIDKSPEELYGFWRNFENLPQFMIHLESVKKIDDKRSNWVAKAPLGTEVKWEALVTDDQPNQRIAWTSTENADVKNSGKVEFIQTDNDRGTEVKVTLKYEPPAGIIGAVAAYFLQEEPNKQVEEDLKRFKKIMESGATITIKGQPAGKARNTQSATA